MSETAALIDSAVKPRKRDAQATRAAILEAAKKIALGGRAVVLASPAIRRTLRKLWEGVLPQLAVLTYAELDVDLQVRPVGRLAF